jgi:formate dehydrogenase major subunit
MVELIVDGKRVTVKRGLTLLEALKTLGIEIPALCYDPRLKPSGDCGLCVVEVKGYGLLKACTTLVGDQMEVYTDTPLLRQVRKGRLEELLREHYGDCVAPCSLNCPAGIDIQNYVALIAKGAFKEAAALIRERLPLPGVVGRVCPHPCEEACRRQLLDEPISIRQLKRFVYDYERKSGEKLLPARAPLTGKRVAIIGSGPAGLSCAYFLALKGHSVTIFEAMPLPGGWLRYGIPPYRLPKDVLDDEIEMIKGLGVQILCNKAWGKDFTLEDLLKDFEAVFIGIGCQRSQALGVPGEELEGVYGGVDFLRDVALGKPVKVGKKVVVVGGGNTAMDAARVALRLGAEEVTVLYRRTRREMPASPWEIEEAEEEGIRFVYLVNPVRVSGNGKVEELICVKMRLTEPDASGRRRPEPVPGSEFSIKVDTVIAAIGQRLDAKLLEKEGIAVERGSIKVDPSTLMTSRERVFAGGDAVLGPATVVEAVAQGRRAAFSIDAFLKGERYVEEKPFNISRGALEEIDKVRLYEGIEKRPRKHMPVLRPEERRDNFKEIELGYQEEAAREEAKRCLRCGCLAQDYCQLRKWAQQLEIEPPKVKGPLYSIEREHPFIERDPNKCIACGLCSRICEEVMGIGAIVHSYRTGTPKGFSAPLLDTPCISCGQCVSACPVGALASKEFLPPEREIRTICPYCGVGCGVVLGVRGNRIVRVKGDFENEVNRGNLCVKGRYGLDFVNHPDRLKKPLIKKNGKFEEVTWEEALDFIAQKLQAYKGDRFAFLASARCTNEENYVFQKFTRVVMGTNNVDHCARL